MKQFTSCVTLKTINSAALLIALFAKVLVNVNTKIGIHMTRRLNTRGEGNARRAVRASLLLYTVTKLLIYIIYLLFSKRVLSVVGAGPRLVSRTILCVGVCTLNVPTVTMCGFNGNMLDTHNSAGQPLVCLSVTKIVGILLGLFFIVIYRVTTTNITATDTVTLCVSTTLMVVRLLQEGSRYEMSLHGLHLRPGTYGTMLLLNVPANLRGKVFTVTGLFMRANIGSFSTIAISKGTTTTGTSSLVCGIVFTFCATYTDFVNRG